MNNINEATIGSHVNAYPCRKVALSLFITAIDNRPKVWECINLYLQDFTPTTYTHIMHYRYIAERSSVLSHCQSSNITLSGNNHCLCSQYILYGRVGFSRLVAIFVLRLHALHKYHSLKCT